MFKFFSVHGNVNTYNLQAYKKKYYVFSKYINYI